MSNKYILVLISMWLLLAIGCSTTPSHTTESEYQPLSDEQLDALQITNYHASKEEVFDATLKALENKNINVIVIMADYQFGHINGTADGIIFNIDIIPGEDDTRVHIIAIDREHIYSLGEGNSMRGKPRYSQRQDGIIERASVYETIFEQIANELGQEPPS